MVIVKTPYRISLVGGGTDFPSWFGENGGAVVSGTISRYCYLTCRDLPPFFSYKSRFVWSRVETVDHTADIVHPSIQGCLKFLGVDSPQLQVHHDGDLPAQSGIGSSASFTVGLLHALRALAGQLVSKHELALDAITVDQDVVGEVVGCQDQVAAAYGGLNKITFGPGKKDFIVQRLPLAEGAMTRLGSHLMLFYTGQSRESSKVEQAKQAQDNRLVLKEQLALVEPCVRALGAGDMLDLAKLLTKSWVLKRSMAAGVSNAAIDDYHERAMRAGALGGKLTGAGGGGCLILVVPPGRQAMVRHALRDLVHVPFSFESQGSQLVYYATGDKVGHELRGV